MTRRFRRGHIECRQRGPGNGRRRYRRSQLAADGFDLPNRPCHQHLPADTGSLDRDAIRLWATENWQDVLTLSLDGSYYELMFSPDGNILGARAYGSEGALHLWRAPSWVEIEEAERSGDGEGKQDEY